MWIFEAITHLINPQPFPTFKNVNFGGHSPPSEASAIHKYPPLPPTAKTEHSQLHWGVTEKVIQEKLLWHKAKLEFLHWEATTSLRTGWRFAEPCCVKTWQFHLSVSPCVNLYLYLLGSWAPPKAWHMVSSEAQNKNIASICTPTCFGGPISTLRKAGWFKSTFKKKFKSSLQCHKNIFSFVYLKYLIRRNTSRENHIYSWAVIQAVGRMNGP